MDLHDIEFCLVRRYDFSQNFTHLAFLLFISKKLVVSYKMKLQFHFLGPTVNTQ